VQSPGSMTEGADVGAGGVKNEPCTAVDAVAADEVKHQGSGRQESSQPQVATGADVKKEDESGQQKSDKPQESGEKKDMGSSTAGGHKGEPNKGSGYDTDYHPADIHPLEDKPGEKKESEGEKDESEKPNLGATEAQRKVDGPDEKNTKIDQTTGKPKDESSSVHGKEGVSEKANETKPPQSPHSRESSDATQAGGAKKKASFVEKMKGEAKILLGKMEGKKGAEKVEEGRRMKAGEAPSPTSA